MQWINVLHLYQPPTQSREIIDKVVRESYETILRLLNTYPKLKLTINISGSLLELLEKYEHRHIIEGLAHHARRGVIEFVGSAMYHPILPLLSEKEITRQIELNTVISRKCFGDVYNPRGFYLPEMAYSTATGHAIKRAGFDWIILDEIHTETPVSAKIKYHIDEVGLDVLFRNTQFSKTFPPEYIVAHINEIGEGPIITCHDGELYGHWHVDDKGFYEKAFTHPHIETLCVSEYIDTLATTAHIKIRDASWESLPEELSKNIPLGLWQHPDNAIHTRLEYLKRHVLTAVEDHQNDPGYAEARHHADKGVASCAWWWASERKIGPFSPVSWNPTEIEKGAKELYEAAQRLTTLSAEDRELIEFLYLQLHETIWVHHKNKYDPNYML